MNKKIIAMAGVVGLGIALGGAPVQAQEFGSPELIAGPRRKANWSSTRRILPKSNSR
jgi:hypothetical protein